MSSHRNTISVHSASGEVERMARREPAGAGLSWGARAGVIVGLSIALWGLLILLVTRF